MSSNLKIHKRFFEEIEPAYEMKNNSHSQHKPSSLFTIYLKSKEREHDIKQKHKTQEPTYSNDLNIRIRQQIKAQGQVCKCLPNTTYGLVECQAYQTKQGKIRPNSLISLRIEVIHRNQSILYSLIIATTHGERTHDKKEIDKIRKETYYFIGRIP